MSIDKKSKNNSMLKKNLILAVLVVAIAVIPLLFLKHAAFTGSDDLAKNEIAKIDANYKPWFYSIWTPPSAEIESLLFSLQAAIGSGVVCFFFGYAKGKAKARAEIEEKTKVEVKEKTIEGEKN
ncbi:energy-coupling factor ABC transporter substrate-binding protein [Clostridium estertheticum]|uniref:energy-coupling factor ABC transporter substrate-binding protein n=1 Tax=Clostridium estertheticum TaxID=238834 RepID=UPI001C0C88BF|nr:energy-coupling factor ABC transporter substrate-binding protein [Clostridium estertheticum]MBU3177178.1 energy-coupling factor ABC transporter substrate-binding protein [Clostridium estertheticum]